MEQFIEAGAYQPEADDQFRSLEEFDRAEDFAAPLAGEEEEFSLDSLLDESMQEVAKAKSAKAAKKALSKGLASVEETAALKKIVANWEIGRLWLPRATVVMFDVQRCTSCGLRHSHFVGFFQRQEHRSSNVMRWVRAAEAPMQASLPEEVKENEHLTEVCAGCYS
jgi:hypothetical protein